MTRPAQALLDGLGVGVTGRGFISDFNSPSDSTADKSGCKAGKSDSCDEATEES